MYYYHHYSKKIWYHSRYKHYTKYRHHKKYGYTRRYLKMLWRFKSTGEPKLSLDQLRALVEG